MKKIFFLFLSVIFFASEVLSQCPMCKASVESSRRAGVKSVGNGLNIGILMLLVAVYVFVFSIGMMWYRKYRKTQVAENAW